MAGGKRESLKVMGQDGVQESGRGPGEESTEIRGWDQDRPRSDWSLADRHDW